jgi:hypothetical protein
MLIDKKSKDDVTIVFSQSANSSGIRTSWDVNKPFNPTTEEELNEIKAMIKADVDAAIQNSITKQAVVVPEKGIGQELLKPMTTKVGKDVTVENNEYRQEIFRYLSELLYTNFGFINPGSQEIPSIMDIIAREQGVSDQDKENLKNRCLTI